jgi:magnesium chelatase family protein
LRAQHATYAGNFRLSIARVQSFAFAGIEAQPVEVQVQISSGLPAFLMVGLPDKAVGEARERVRAALTAMGLALPPKRILVNLAPADVLKEGSHFDLPVALAVLAAMDVLPREELALFAALGELSLDGRIMPVAGVLPAAIAAGARELGLICPETQGPEAGWAGELTVLAAPDLLSLINHFRGTQILSPPPAGMLGGGFKTLDLADVRGMETARRALEIAAAGGHNLMMIGPPRRRQDDAGGKAAWAAAGFAAARGAGGEHGAFGRRLARGRPAGDAAAVPGTASFGQHGGDQRRRQPSQAR